ncbi:MAG: DUF1315 family protein [Pseudomonadota bacterium]
MNYLDLVENMTPEIYKNLKRSVEVGKWPDGSALTREQRTTALQAVIAWGKLHLPEDEQVGFIDRGDKAGEACDDTLETPLKWTQD